MSASFASTPAARVRPDGAALGTVRGSSHLFTAMVVGAVLLFPLAAWLVPTESTPERVGLRAALRSFLEDGPTTGLWEAQRLYDRRRAYFAPLRGHPDRILMAPAPTPELSFCRTCDSPCSYTRPQATQFFFEAPASLFLANYVREGEPVPSRLDDGTPALMATWVPRRLADREDGEPTLTGRDVWFDAEDGIVLQIEDHSRSGHPVRRVWRVSPETGRWDPSTFDPAGDPVCAHPCPSCRGTTEEQLRRVQARAPFPLVRPTYLPPGYALVRAVYREVTVPIEGDGGGESVVPARISTLLYSDGLGLISIAMAPAEEMDLLEARFARMREGDPERAEGSTCPTLPVTEATTARGRGGIVRWRSDACRTVARLDRVHGLSVTLLARNEVSGDAYLAVIQSLAPMGE